MEYGALLQKCLLFEHLTESEINKLCEIVQEKEFEKDAQIFEKGDTGDSLFIIIEGSVRVSVILADVGEEVLAILRKGAHFGEMAIIDKGTRSATIIAHEDTKLLQIEKSNFDELLQLNKEMELKILRSMVKAFSSRIRDTDQSLTFLRFTLRKDQHHII